MRFLLANNHCITDPTAGVTQSLRTIVEWLSEAGHECRVLTTARFESAVTFTIDEHLRQHDVDVRAIAAAHKKSGARGVPVATYQAGRVPVTLLLTRHNDEARPHTAEAKQYLRIFDAVVDEFAPNVLIACNGHPMVFEAMARARERGIATAFAVRGFGYDDRAYFEHVDHAFTCSDFLTRVYARDIGLRSVPLEPPIEWDAVAAPEDSRAFVTFVNPSPHKGLFLFARLADMLGARRPDIPILVVQSGRSGGGFNSIPGLDFSRYPQIMAAPAVPAPRDYFALTRLLVVPSVWEEPFGRVAAEAMINGIPPVVSDRGSLPDVIGGDLRDGGAGRVVAVPPQLIERNTSLPSESDIEPWFDAVCALWDDRALYDRAAARARVIADERYSERVSRKKHIDYFESLQPGVRPFAD